MISDAHAQQGLLRLAHPRIYDLNRDELPYILEPAAPQVGVPSAPSPTETFRVLKTNDLKSHGEYCTRRLVLEAWDNGAISEKSDATTK